MVLYVTVEWHDGVNIVAADGTKRSRKNKSDNVGVTAVGKICRKKLKKKPQRSNCVTGSANAFGNYSFTFCADIRRPPCHYSCICSLTGQPAS